MRALPLLLLLGSASSFSLWANPTGGVVADGSASIAGQGTSSVLINQSSDRAIINWQTFSIGSGELTKFIQPSSTSAALNRVLGGQTSYINGTLSANGQIFLLNGNGVVVGPGGVISTAGFTGSTRDIADSDFMSNNLHFVGSGDGGVKNLGTISALGGDVVLIGKTVENRGTIKATGTAALVAGDDILLAQKNADGSTVTVNPVSSAGPATKKVGVKNTGTIEASSAELKAANGNIYALAIQNEGLVQATTVTKQGGHIYLTSDDGTIVNSGTLDASATAAGGAGGTVLVKSTAGKVVHSGSILARGGAGGTGGNAEVSAPVVDYTGTVDLRATGGTSGTLLLDPDNLVVNATGTGNAPDTSYISTTSVDNALSGGDFVLNTNDNLAVNAEIDWYTGSNLTLSTNDVGSTIAINAPINGPYGSLTLETAGSNDLITTTLAGTVTVTNFYLQSGAWFQLVDDGSGNGGDIPQTYDAHGNALGTLPIFTVTGDFEINGGTFLRANGGNGTTAYYGLVDVYGLQGMNGYLNSNFTLNGGNIDAGVTSNWNPTTVGESTVAQGFLPIGANSEGGFQGALDNGSISNLYINRTASEGVGLISTLYSNGALDGNGNLAEGIVHDLQLNYASIQGGSNVGGVVGYNAGALDNVSVFDSTITATTDVGGVVGFQSYGYLDENGDQVHTNGSQDGYSTITGQSYVGGLVGENEGQIDGISVYNTTVTGSSYVGGVVGSNDYVSDGPAATIVYATFSGSVAYNDSNGESYNFGGIAGENDGLIEYSNTFPGATVAGDTDVGGVAGYNTGLIQDSYNSAAVTGVAHDGGNTYIGGVVGENNGYQNQSYNTDSISVMSYAEGNQPTFVQYGTVQTSYNTGTVTGGTYVGGIAGSNDLSGNVVNTDYNVGHVIGTSDVGGLVGDNSGTVEYVYDSGPVSGSTGTTGALVGYNESGAVTTDSYWDDSITGQAPVALNGTAGTSIGTVETTPFGTTGSAYDPASYAYFGMVTPESTASPGLVNNGVDEIGTSPDGGGTMSWFILPGDTRPILTAEFSGNISNPHQLQLISTDLTGNFDVVQNINASVVTNPSEVWSSAGFSPIGTNPVNGNSYFTGTVYGNNETISGLYINRSTTNYVGLFGYVGRLAGNNSYSIENLNLTGGSITGNFFVGALAGANSGSIFYVNADTTVTGDYAVGGLVGSNASYGVISQDMNAGTITGSGSDHSDIGGIAGDNSNIVSQDYNTGNVGSAGNVIVGGIVGSNNGQVDDSYSGGGSASGTITGSALVGGLVGDNSGTLETSYSTSPVDSTSTNSGYLVGSNYGLVAHSYWDTQTVGTDAANGVGFNDTDAGGTEVDVQGYTTMQLSEATNYAQGAQPQLWNFSPQGTNPGVWGIDVYQGTYTYDSQTENDVLSNTQVNGGLPVLQWQTPVSVEVAATNGPHDYGYMPGYTVSGSGAPYLASYMPGGATVSVTGGNQAGDTDHVTVSPTALTTTGVNIEFLDGTVPIDPAPLYIVANSYTVPVGSPAPDYGATYSGLQNGDTPSDLNGTLTFTVPPNATETPSLYTIGVSGQSSSNYIISFISGVLDVFSKTASPQTQQVLTAEAEVGTIQNFFANDPANGLDSIYFLIIPNQFGLGGDLLGAINTEPHSTDYAYASSTSGLPAFSRLVLPDTGVVEILDGAVVVGSPKTGQPIFLTNPGGFLPSTVVNNLRNVLSPSAYQQLLALINGY